eukprot:9268010-Alexandrium_andersonii.AAC.1
MCIRDRVEAGVLASRLASGRSRGRELAHRAGSAALEVVLQGTRACRLFAARRTCARGQRPAAGR